MPMRARASSHSGLIRRHHRHANKRVASGQMRRYFKSHTLAGWDPRKPGTPNLDHTVSICRRRCDQHSHLHTVSISFPDISQPKFRTVRDRRASTLSASMLWRFASLASATVPAELEAEPTQPRHVERVVHSIPAMLNIDLSNKRRVLNPASAFAQWRVPLRMYVFPTKS